MYPATEIEFDLQRGLNRRPASVIESSAQLKMRRLRPGCRIARQIANLLRDIRLRLHDQLHPPGFTPRKDMQLFDLNLTKNVTLYFRQSAPCKMVCYDAA